MSKKEISEEFEKSLLSSTIKNKVMTIAESLKLEGRQEGEASLLTRQIKRRFPNEVTSRHLYLINEADEETLSSWGEKLMDAKSLDEIFVDFL